MILASKSNKREPSRFSAASRARTKNVTVAFCSTLVSILGCMPVQADDAAAVQTSASTNVSPAGSVPAASAVSAPPVTPQTTGNKQIAAIEVPKKDDDASAENAQKIILKPGQPLVLGTDTEDVQPTDDVNLAREQAAHFPDSAEAAFILAVALTRTSQVEEALKEVRVARRLAQAAGGPAYFDKMIKSYEEMLQDVDDPRVRYSLAWAYYMKAYLLAQDSRRALSNPVQVVPNSTQATAPALLPAAAAATTTTTTTATAQTAATSPVTAPASAATATTPPVVPQNTTVPSTVSARAEKKKVDPNLAIQILQGLNPDIAAKMSADGGKVPAAQLPTIPTAIQKAAPSAVPQIHQYYADALRNLDAVLAKKPDDVWALLYRWHLYAEDTGNLGEAMKHWRDAERRFPSNPGVQFFLGEGYLKEGNLKEAVMHASKAILLRGLGN